MRSHPYVLIYLTVRQEKHQCHLIWCPEMIIDTHMFLSDYFY
jgi:hypothetical protein